MIVISYAYPAEIKFLKQLIEKSSFKNNVSFIHVNKLVKCVNSEIDLMVNVGFAGALNQKLSLGETVNVVKIFRIANEKVSSVEIKNESKFDLANIKNASLLTSKDPVNSIPKREDLLEKTGADIVDMEGYSLQEIAKEKKIPLVVIKLVSDNADSDAWNMIKQNKERWSKALGETVYELIASYSKRDSVK